MLVQRGTITIASGNLSASIDLVTPVPVGESFLLTSCRAGADATGWDRFAASAKLSDVSGGNWTKVTAERANTTDSAIVHWEVITDPGFTVQTGSTYMDATSKDETISAVVLAETFVVGSHRTGAVSNFGQVPVRLQLTTTTNLQLRVGNVTVSGYVEWYVVSWSGATVEHFAVSSTGHGAAQAITTVDLTKSFLVHSAYYGGTTTGPANAFVRCWFSSASEVTYYRGSTDNTIYVAFSVVTHGSISVQAVTAKAGATAGTITDALTAVDLTRSFIPSQNMMGNHHFTGTTNRVWNCLATQELSAEDEWQAIRGGAQTGLEYAYFVVGRASVPTVIGLNRADLDARFAARFGWTYTDPDDDPQEAYQAKIYEEDTWYYVDATGDLTEAETWVDSSNHYFDLLPNMLWNEYGEEYQWQVRVRDDRGLVSEWSAIATFNATPRMYLTELWPGDEELYGNSTIQVWATYQNLDDEMGYIRFELDTVNTFDSANLATHEAGYRDPGMTGFLSKANAARGVWYWRARASEYGSPAVHGDWTTTRSLERVQASAHLVTPADEAEVTAAPQELQVRIYTDDASTASARVQLDTAATFDGVDLVEYESDPAVSNTLHRVSHAFLGKQSWYWRAQHPGTREDALGNDLTGGAGFGIGGGTLGTAYVAPSTGTIEEVVVWAENTSFTEPRKLKIGVFSALGVLLEETYALELAANSGEDWRTLTLKAPVAVTEGTTYILMVWGAANMLTRYQGTTNDTYYYANIFEEDGGWDGVGAVQANQYHLRAYAEILSWTVLRELAVNTSAALPTSVTPADIAHLVLPLVTGELAMSAVLGHVLTPTEGATLCLQVQVAVDIDFTAPETYTSARVLAGQRATVTLELEAGTFYIRLRALADYGDDSAWLTYESSVLLFTTFVEPPQWQAQLGPRPNRVYVRILGGTTVRTASLAGVDADKRVDHWAEVPAGTSTANADSTAGAILDTLQARQVRVAGTVPLMVQADFDHQVEAEWWERDGDNSVLRERQTLVVARKTHDIDAGTTELHLGDYTPPGDEILARILAKLSRP